MRGRLLISIVCFASVTFTPLHAQSSIDELNKAGWQMIEQGDGARAEALFARALAIRPDDPVLLFGAGVSAHLQQRPADARVKLRRVVELNPRLTSASLLLGELAYRDGDIREAIKTYESALRFEPAHPHMTERLAEWRKEDDLHGTFIERQQGRFSVMFEGQTDSVMGARVTQSLNNAFSRISRGLGTFPSDPIVVILYTEKQFHDITRAPEWSSGLYDGRIRVPVANAPPGSVLFEQVLAHELTHAMVASIAPRGVPTWLHEGLAQHFAGSDAQAARRRLQSRRQLISFELLEGGFQRLNTPAAVLAYDQSLLAVDAMAQNPHVNWSQLLYALAESGTPEQALQKFGVGYAKLEAALTH